MRHTSSKHFVRPRFHPSPSKSFSATSDQDEISSLSGLIRFNAEKNNKEIFCKQALIVQNPALDEDDKSFGNKYHCCSISYGQLDAAVRACAAWIGKALRRALMEDHRPIALYMESDVGLFIYLAALTELKIPVRVPVVQPHHNYKS